jgi:hypothetical protein
MALRSSDLIEMQCNASKLAEADVLLLKAHAVQIELYCRFDGESMLVLIREVLRMPRFFIVLSSAARCRFWKKLRQSLATSGKGWLRILPAVVEP